MTKVFPTIDPRDAQPGDLLHIYLKKRGSKLAATGTYRVVRVDKESDDLIATGGFPEHTAWGKEVRIQCRPLHITQLMERDGHPVDLVAVY